MWYFNDSWEVKVTTLKALKLLLLSTVVRHRKWHWWLLHLSARESIVLSKGQARKALGITESTVKRENLPNYGKAKSDKNTHKLYC